MKLKILVLTIILTEIILGQSVGKIIGYVKDNVTQEALIGVNLILEGTNIGAATNVDGYYEISNVPFGDYSLKASYIGYEEIKKSDVLVLASKPTQIDFMMKEATIKLDGVIVTSGYYDQIRTEPVSVSSFNYEEIRRTPGGFEDVVRALSIIPGVAKQSGGRNDLVVRGGAPSENLYILDGFVVPNINHFSTQGASGGTNSYVDLDFINNATFSTGGFSVKYGDRLSSTLGIDLRSPRQDKIGGKALISATQFGLNLEGPVTQNSDFLFSIRRSYLDFLFNAAGFSFVPQYWDMLFKYNYKFSNNDKLSVLFVGALDDVSFNNNSRDDLIDNSRILANSQNQYTFGVSYQHLLGNGFIDFRYSRNFVDYDNSQRDTLLNPIYLNQSVEATNNLGADMVLKTSQNSEVNLGIGYEFIGSENTVIFPDNFVTTFGDTLTQSNVKGDNNYNKANLYGLYSITLFERLVLNGGLRFDYFSALEEKFTISPRFSFRYAASDVVSLNFATGIYRQSPSYIWLLYPGNNNLKPIQVEQYILGAEHIFRSDIRMKVEGFFKNYKYYPTSELRNYLVMANTGAGFGGAEDNFASIGYESLISNGTGISRGIEFSIQKKVSETPYYGILSVTYSQTDFTALDQIERNGQFDQNWIANLSAGYIYNSNWIFSMKFRYASGFPYTPFQDNGTQLVEEYLSLRLPDSYALDVRVDKIWDFSGWTLVTYIDIQNITNRKNVNSVRWDYKTNEQEFSEELGILPSIGISIEF